MSSLMKGNQLIWLLLLTYLDFATPDNKTDAPRTTWESWNKCNTTCGKGHQTRSRACVDIETNENCTTVYTEFRICAGLDCTGKSNTSRRHRKVQKDDNIGIDNAVNSAVYSLVIFIPGIIGFIFVCIRTHRKTKMEEKQLREVERRKLSLRNDDIT